MRGLPALASLIVPASPAELHQPQPAAPHALLETALKVTVGAMASPARATMTTGEPPPPVERRRRTKRQGMERGFREPLGEDAARTRGGAPSHEAAASSQEERVALQRLQQRHAACGHVATAASGTAACVNGCRYGAVNGCRYGAASLPRGLPQLRSAGTARAAHSEGTHRPAAAKPHCG